MTDTQLTPEQYELFKNAENRLKQKRLLYLHFFAFVLGSIFFVVANKVLDYGATYNWYLWAILEQLIAAQQKKLIKMEAAVEKELATQKEQAKRELAAEQAEKDNEQTNTSSTNF